MNQYDYKISIGSLNRHFYKQENFNQSDLINFSEELLVNLSFKYQNSILYTTWVGSQTLQLCPFLY